MRGRQWLKSIRDTCFVYRNAQYAHALYIIVTI
jgi:hypothetical protein